MQNKCLLVSSLFVGLALAACGSTPGPTQTNSTTTTSSTVTSLGTESTTTSKGHESPTGAVQGLIEAMKTNNTQLFQEWLPPAPSTDRGKVDSIPQQASSMGLQEVFFFSMPTATVTDAKTTASDQAIVTLSTPLTWCVGVNPQDSKALCALFPNAGTANTLKVVNVNGLWYVDVDLTQSHPDPSIKPTLIPVPASTSTSLNSSGHGTGTVGGDHTPPGQVSHTPTPPNPSDTPLPGPTGGGQG